MTYRRVIPRDLFNEGNLLKCYGRLAILLGETDRHRARLEHDGGPFEPLQDPSDGSLTLWPSVRFLVEIEGEETNVRLYRPLNSRAGWPLYAEDPSGEDIPVFPDNAQRFTPEFLDLIGLEEPADRAAACPHGEPDRDCHDCLEERRDA